MVKETFNESVETFFELAQNHFRDLKQSTLAEVLTTSSREEINISINGMIFLGQHIDAPQDFKDLTRDLVLDGEFGPKAQACFKWLKESIQKQ